MEQEVIRRVTLVTNISVILSILDKKKEMRYFTFNELFRSDTALKMGIDNMPNSPDIRDSLTRLVNEILDPVRGRWGSPIRVTSGYRCKELNKAVGGSRTSQHLVGEAADIVPTNGDVRGLFILIKQMINNGEIEVGQAILEYGGSSRPRWIHVSLRNSRHHNEIRYIY